MSIKEPPIIEDAKEGDFTMITFEPDLKKFGMEKLDEDILSLMQKRVIDVAGTTNSSIEVYLNGKKLPQTFEEYINYYYLRDEKLENLKMFDNPSNTWEVMLTLSYNGFSHVSFCNGISTPKGGTHVNHVADEVSNVFFIMYKASGKYGE